MSPDPLATYQGPILVTALYFALWYGLLLGYQRSTKYALLAEYDARGEAFDRYFGQDPRMLAADRTVVNTHEQMVPFLTGLWLHAVLVSPAHATWLGLAYVGFRALYPFLLGRRLERTQTKWVFLATGPAYAIVFTLLGRVVYATLMAA